MYPHSGGIYNKNGPTVDQDVSLTTFRRDVTLSTFRGMCKITYIQAERKFTHIQTGFTFTSSSVEHKFTHIQEECKFAHIREGNQLNLIPKRPKRRQDASKTAPFQDGLRRFQEPRAWKMGPTLESSWFRQALSLHTFRQIENYSHLGGR